MRADHHGGVLPDLAVDLRDYYHSRARTSWLNRIVGLWMGPALTERFTVLAQQSSTKLYFLIAMPNDDRSRNFGGSRMRPEVTRLRSARDRRFVATSV